MPVSNAIQAAITARWRTSIEEHFTNFQRLEEELLEAELAAILRLRDEGIINDEVLRKVQQDLDLELVRLHQEG